MNYKPGDKVWVTRTSLARCRGNFPINKPQAGVVLGLNARYCRHFGFVVYDVSIPGSLNPKDGSIHWQCTQGTLRPRDDPDDEFPEPSAECHDPNRVVSWGYGGTWVPDAVKAEILWFFVPNDR
jgi:hypothetical protein